MSCAGFSISVRIVHTGGSGGKAIININVMSTTNHFFVNYNRAFIHNLIRKSTLISEVGERIRSRFFHLIHERIRRSMQQTLGASSINLNT